MSIQCFLALGSNLRTPRRQIELAVQGLRTLPKTEIQWIASPLMTKPLGAIYQPQYCNTIVEIKTTLTPRQLLLYCQKIEKTQGRVRKKRWASRTLDIDILIFGKQIIKEVHLTIPHAEILSRKFVYEPLFKKAPELQLFLEACLEAT